MSLAAEQFTETVERFCEWAEGQDHSLIDGRQLLVSLITSIPHLVGYRYSGTSDEEFPRREHAGWQEDHKRFSDLPFQYYRVVFDPLDFDSTDEPVTGDLHDDFADIYGDLWHGLQARRAGDLKEALSLWIDSYFFHWGQHATSALGAIDAFYRQDPNRSEQDSGGQQATRPESE
jgi:hypothetical protein